MMIVALSLAVTLGAAAPQDTPQRPEDLSYMETYACMRLGQIGRGELIETGAVAPEDQDLYDDFGVLEQKAAGALEAAKVREGDRLSPLEIEHGAAEELLEAMTDDQMYSAMNICGNVFLGAGD